MTAELPRRTAILAALLLAACGPKQVHEPAASGGDGTASSPALNPLPNSVGAAWRVAPDGKGLLFARPGEKPLLTLRCQLSAKAPPQLAIIRHAQSEPGAKALFAVLGNGITARLKLDAKLAGEGWRWEGSYPANAPELDVFTGQHDIEATLPGAGMLRIGGSGLPREFLGWCRRGGAVSPPSPDPQGSTG